jgi:hypothetical protein
LRRLVQAEARPLVVFAEREAAEAADRVGVAGADIVTELATELAHPLQGRVEVVDAEEQVRARARIAAV